jgi:hypothetical protein
MRRRVSPVLVATALVVSLAGCAGAQTSTVPSPSPTGRTGAAPVPGAPTPTPTVMAQDVPQTIDEVDAVDAAEVLAATVEAELAEPVPAAG